jgi:murein DD-endopeptidase MepM/ murein hydrolase activator NlpD
MFVGRGIGSAALFTIRIPVRTVGLVTHASGMNNVLQPADHAPVPIIDPHSPALLAAQKALPAAPAPAPASQAAAPSAVITPQWPIHGVITTLFGVPELPYQAIHTGLDISDGKAPGTTPILPFRPGTVTDVIHGGGLGNHVVVDHGSGVTSVYGHLNSTSVQVGQVVNESTVLGFEGTTGVSTGTHLHFEIRVNGQAVDPQKFISGHP